MPSESLTSALIMPLYAIPEIDTSGKSPQERGDGPSSALSPAGEEYIPTRVAGVRDGASISRHEASRRLSTRVPIFA